MPNAFGQHHHQMNAWTPNPVDPTRFNYGTMYDQWGRVSAPPMAPMMMAAPGTYNYFAPPPSSSTSGVPVSATNSNALAAASMPTHLPNVCFEGEEEEEGSNPVCESSGLLLNTDLDSSKQDVTATSNKDSNMSQTKSTDFLSSSQQQQQHNIRPLASPAGSMYQQHHIIHHHQPPISHHSRATIAVPPPPHIIHPGMRLVPQNNASMRGVNSAHISQQLQSRQSAQGDSNYNNQHLNYRNSNQQNSAPKLLAPLTSLHIKKLVDKYKSSTPGNTISTSSSSSSSPATLAASLANEHPWPVKPVTPTIRLMTSPELDSVMRSLLNQSTRNPELQRPDGKFIFRSKQQNDTSANSALSAVSTGNVGGPPLPPNQQRMSGPYASSSNNNHVNMLHQTAAASTNPRNNSLLNSLKGPKASTSSALSNNLNNSTDAAAEEFPRSRFGKVAYASIRAPRALLDMSGLSKPVQSGATPLSGPAADPDTSPLENLLNPLTGHPSSNNLSSHSSSHPLRSTSAQDRANLGAEPSLEDEELKSRQQRDARVIACSRTIDQHLMKLQSGAYSDPSSLHASEQRLVRSALELMYRCVLDALDQEESIASATVRRFPRENLLELISLRDSSLSTALFLLLPRGRGFRATESVAALPEGSNTIPSFHCSAEEMVTAARVSRNVLSNAPSSAHTPPEPFWLLHQILALSKGRRLVANLGSFLVQLLTEPYIAMTYGHLSSPILVPRCVCSGLLAILFGMSADPFGFATILRASPSLAPVSTRNVSKHPASSVTWLDDWYEQILAFHYAEVAVNVASAADAFSGLLNRVDPAAAAVRHSSIPSLALPTPDSSSAALAATIRRIIYRLLPTSTSSSAYDFNTAAPAANLRPFAGEARIISTLGTRGILWALLDILIPPADVPSTAAVHEVSALVGSFGALHLITSLASSLPERVEIETNWDGASVPPNPIFRLLSLMGPALTTVIVRFPGVHSWPSLSPLAHVSPLPSNTPTEGGSPSLAAILASLRALATIDLALLGAEHDPVRILENSFFNEALWGMLCLPYYGEGTSIERAVRANVRIALAALAAALVAMSLNLNSNITNLLLSVLSDEATA